MEIFRKLGDDVEAAWRERDYDEAALPEIAKTKLIEHDIPSRTEPWEVIRWTLRADELIRQKDPTASFGEPPVTVYQGARFHIDVYFWFSATTTVHQHAFSGAFQVFAGSSIHSSYEFEPDDPVNVYMQFGTMRLKLCEVLEKGDVQEIRYGRQYIHSLFHLDEPSVTIVVRTKESPLSLPQYSYEKPFVAIDPFFTHDTLTKKLQAIGALLRSKHENADQLIAELIDRSDIHSTYIILARIRPLLKANNVEKMFSIDKQKGRFDALIDVAARRHGKRTELMVAGFAHAEREMAIVMRRAYITDPDLRFFIAAVLNVEGRENIYHLIKQRHPDADPQEKILDWVFDLANTRIIQFDPPNALGIADFDDRDLALLETMLAGGEVDSNSRERFGTIRRSDMLGPLFT